MFKVCFYSSYSQKETIVSKHKTLTKASEVARQLTIETNATHYIVTKENTKLDRYGKVELVKESELE